MLALILCLLISGCTRKIELQDGFRVVRTSGNSRTLVKPDGVALIYPTVANAVDDDQFIIGLREDIGFGLRLSEGFEDQPYGYFIYDKTIQERVMGLSENELAELTEEKGIDLTLDR